MSALVLKRPPPRLLPVVLMDRQDDNSSSNNNKAEFEPRAFIASSSSSSTSAAAAESSRRRASLSSSTYVQPTTLSAKETTVTRFTSGLTLPPSPLKADEHISTGDNDSEWLLLDKYHDLNKHLPTSAAAPSVAVISSFTHNPARSHRNNYSSRHLPSQDFPLTSSRKGPLNAAPPHHSIMSMSLYGEKDILTASSPLVASRSPKPVRVFNNHSSSSSMFKSAVTIQKLELDNSSNPPPIATDNNKILVNHAQDNNNGINESKMSPSASHRRPASTYDAGNDDDFDGCLLVEQVILRRSRHSKLVLQRDGLSNVQPNYENFISNARPNDADQSRSPVLRLFRQPELRLRNSFSGRHCNNGNCSPRLTTNDSSINPPRSRQSFQPSAAFASKTANFNFNPLTASFSGEMASTVTTTATNTGSPSTEGPPGQVLATSNLNDEYGGALENSELEFSPDDKTKINPNDSASGRLVNNTFIANQQQQDPADQHPRPSTADGVVRQLVRRPRTFAAADTQTSPMVIRYSNGRQNQSAVSPTPTSPYEGENGSTGGVNGHRMLPRSPSSAADCSASSSNIIEPITNGDAALHPRQRVFPRTNPAFCRRNKQTTIVGAGGRELSPVSPTGDGEPVELLPGGIVYEHQPGSRINGMNGTPSRFRGESPVVPPVQSSSRLLTTVLSASSSSPMANGESQQQQRSQTLDNRYRHSNGNHQHQQQQVAGQQVGQYNQINILASPSRAQRPSVEIQQAGGYHASSNSRQFYLPNLPAIVDPHQPPYSQPLERKFTFEPSSTALPISPQPSDILIQQQHNNNNVSSAEVTPRGASELTPTSSSILMGGIHGSSQRSLNKDSLDSGYLPSDSQHHPSTSSSNQAYSRQSATSATGSFRRPSTSSSSSEPLSSSLERSPSPMRQQQRARQQPQAHRRRPAPPSRRRHGNPPSTIFEPPASDASSDVSDCARNSIAIANNPLGLQNMASSLAYHEGSMSDPDTLLHNMSASLSRGSGGGGSGSNTGSYAGPHSSHLLRANGMSASAAHASSIQTPLDKSYSSQVEPVPGRPLSMLISQSEVSVGAAAHQMMLNNGRRHPQPSSASALLLQHHHHSSMLSSAGGSLRLTPLQLLRKAGAAGTLPGSVGCAHGVALAAALQMYARTRKPLFSDADIELYAQQFMATHRRGLFGRKYSISEMLCWTKDLIQKPMLRTTCDKAARRLCVDTFRLIQQYMGDRRTTTPSLAIAAEIVTRGWLHPNLRDEIYMQLCRQTTETPVQEGLERGWELMATCLNFFPPSLHFYGYIESYVFRHTDQNYDTPKVPVSHYASYCLRQLERVVESGAKKGVKRPTIDEIDQARSSVFQPSMFGATLDDIMLVQAARFPVRRLPWIQTTLSEAVLRLNGAQTEGIFRIPGDIDEVNALKARVNQWLPPDNIRDPHVPASLLKLWYRELWTPVITPDLYAACLVAGENAQEAIQIFASLPEINRLVLAYLIRFLQVFAAPTNAAVTKMDVSNLAMVFAPNVLRCSSDDPRVIFESTRREMTFLRTLILHLDTNFVEGVI